MKAVVAAIGMAACAGTAVAQTNVSVYGLIDVAVQSATTGGQRTTRLDTSSIAPSRIGFQGNEDLGGGLQAVFRLENGFNADTGTIANGGALFGREAWVGLKGGFGQVQAGVNYTPLFLSYVTYAQGELNALGWGNAANNFVFVPAARTSNSVRYMSAPLGGFTVRGLYSFGNEDTAGQPRYLGKTAALGVNYKAGNLSIDADLMTQTYAAGAVSATAASEQGRYALIGASYDFGMVKPAFLYQKHTGSGAVASANNAAFANPDNYFYEVNALIRTNPNGTLLVSYGQYKKASSSTGDATSYGVRYDYSLSKRTGVYVGFNRVQNESAAAFTVNNAAGPGVATTTGNSINAAIVGMIHRF